MMLFSYTQQILISNSWCIYASVNYRPSLVQIMVCRLPDAKPISEPILNYWQVQLWQQIAMKFESKFDFFTWFETGVCKTIANLSRPHVLCKFTKCRDISRYLVGFSSAVLTKQTYFQTNHCKFATGNSPNNFPGTAIARSCRNFAWDWHLINEVSTCFFLFCGTYIIFFLHLIVIQHHLIWAWFAVWDPFYQHGSIFIPVWVDNFAHYKV